MHYFSFQDEMCEVMYALKHISMSGAIPPIPEMDEVPKSLCISPHP